MKIAEFLRQESVIANLKAATKTEALSQLSQAIAATTPGLRRERVLEVLLEREKLGSTGIGDGIAIPHGKLAGLSGLTAAFAVAPEGVDFEAIDGKKTQLFFALLAPENSANLHLRALARISRLFKNPSFREAILRATAADEVFALIAREDAGA